MVDLSLASIQSTAEAGWWKIMGGLAVGAIVIVAFLMVVGICVFFYFMVNYNVKIHYFETFGNAKSKENGTADYSSLSLGKMKKARGRLLIKRGVKYFKILMPNRTLPPIPSDMNYPEGVYLLKINNDFIPIFKPNVADDNHMVVKLYNVDTWIQRRKLMIQELDKIYPERDVQMRIFILFVVAIICITIFAGLVLWFSFNSANKMITKVDLVANALNSLSAGNLKMPT